MYVPIDVLVGSMQARALARSALPDAPVKASTPQIPKSSGRSSGRERGRAAKFTRARRVTTLDA